MIQGQQESLKCRQFFPFCSLLIVTLKATCKEYKHPKKPVDSGEAEIGHEQGNVGAVMPPGMRQHTRDLSPWLMEGAALARDVREHLALGSC